MLRRWEEFHPQALGFMPSWEALCAETEPGRRSRATFRLQLIVDVLQVERAVARILCNDLLPPVEQLHAHRIVGSAMSHRRGRSGKVGDNGHREERSEKQYREVYPSDCSLSAFRSLHTRHKWHRPVARVTLPEIGRASRSSGRIASAAEFPSGPLNDG